MDDALSSDNETQIITRYQRENEVEQPQPPPAQKRRTFLEPYSSQLQTHVIFRSPILN